MTDFSAANFPSTGANVPTTLEQSLILLCNAWADVHGQTRYRERPATAIDNGYEQIAVANYQPTPDGYMYIGRVCIPISPNFMSPEDGLKLHKYGLERIEGPFPVRYTR